jgi:molecular chaperone DnaK (HSP70)
MKYILLLDLRKRICDVSILKSDNDIIEVISKATHNHFEGKDFDNQL